MPDPAIRPATIADAPAIARIFNEGVAERVATFETREQTAEDIRERIEGGAAMLVAEADGDVAGFARISPYDDAHHYYAGIGEATLYVDRSHRRGGVGAALLGALAAESERRGLYKLVGKIFSSNAPSIALVERCGWRRVGLHLRHGRLDGQWKDVVVVEMLLTGAADEGGPPLPTTGGAG
jgi:phosphinothricin acetyltransferase